MFVLSMATERKIEANAQDDPRWQLVRRVLESETFTRTPRLAEFLTFITERTLTGQVSSINEQEIGVKVFGRESGYLQSDDNIVRVNASRLRQRLDEYFSSEGARETRRISLPKGRYIPEFVEVEIDPMEKDQNHPPSDALSLKESLIAPPLLKTRRLAIPWAISGVVICFVGLLFAAFHVPSGTFIRMGKAPLSRDPFWTPFLSGESPALVVPADSSLIVYDRLAHTTVGLPEYMSGSYRTAKDNENDAQRETRSIAQRRTVATADLSFVTTLQKMSDASNGQIKVIFARDLRLQDVQNSNAILLGARASNPWVALYDSERHFSLMADENTRMYTIRNDYPSDHEFDVLQYQAKDPQYLAYALVAYVPNMDKKHNVLILEGTLESGTQAAMDFVFNSEQLSTLVSKHRRTDGKLPHFEFVLECDAMSGKSPGARIVAQRFF
jgi:hypothetical protein